MQRSAIKNILSVAVSFVVLLAGFFAWIFYGAPIHDLRLWVLEQQFIHANIHHPVESVLLGRKNYLGPSPYGSICVYATGEVRLAALRKNKILSAYQDTSVGKLPLKTYFTDESELPYEIPFGDWQSELIDAPHATGTVYVVYIATKHHFLGDQRCDD